MPMGFSFQPGADVSMNGPNGATGRSLPAPTSATKVLSFRMPKQAPMGALAPSALLNATGGAGVQSGGLSPQLLAMLLSAFSAPAQGGPFGGGNMGQMSPSGTPSFGPPRVVPGDQGDRLRAPVPSEPGLETGGGFFDRSNPAPGNRTNPGYMPPGWDQPSIPQAPAPQGNPVGMGMDYQTYGMMPDYFR